MSLLASIERSEICNCQVGPIFRLRQSALPAPPRQCLASSPARLKLEPVTPARQGGIARFSRASCVRAMSTGRARRTLSSDKHDTNDDRQIKREFGLTRIFFLRLCSDEADARRSNAGGARRRGGARALRQRKPALSASRFGEQTSTAPLDAGLGCGVLLASALLRLAVRAAAARAIPGSACRAPRHGRSTRPRRIAAPS